MILLISDLHLDPKRPAITQAFFEFLNTTAQAADVEALYILGDFFEVWLGDDDDTPIYQETIRQLKQFTDNGTPVYFMHGNRDFLVGRDFALQTGAILLPDPSVIHHQGHDYLLMHGDSLCTKDHEYMAFRRTTRSAQWQNALLSRSLEERKAYAKEVREKSQSMNSLKAEDIMDVTAEEVTRIMSEHKVDTLIHGHTHRPNIHSLNTGAQRIVLGDWGSLGWYITLSREKPILQSFPITIM
jgi:UDP-2,3-diacylglucosamine hydrolase